MRIHEAPIYVADTETTGLVYAEGARIVEFAAKAFHGNHEFTTLVNPGHPIPAQTSAIHGLIDEDVASAPSLDDAYAAIDAFLPRDAVVVFQNAAFDTTMLPCLGARRVLCTKRLAQHVLPSAPGFSNAVLRYHLGGARIDLRGIPTHRAIADVLVTSFVLGKLIDVYLELGNPDDIDSLIALAAGNIWYSHFPKGKYRNQPLSAADAGYLRWALGPAGWTGDDDADLRASIAAELDSRSGRMVLR